MNDSYAVVSFARKQSERCPNKMLRPFCRTTLTDIMLSKLALLDFPTYFGGYEEEFKVRCATHGVAFVQREKESVTIDEPITEILSFLRDIPQKNILLVNACLPFLRVDTISQFLSEVIDGNIESAFGVIKRNNFYFDARKVPVNFSVNMKTINTKKVDSMYEFAHALYFFDKDYFFTVGRYWDWESVRLLEMGGKAELVDIDTEEDFAFAEALYNANNKKS